MNVMSDCAFCRIIQDDDPADIVETGRYYVAFRPLEPYTRRHVLFVPRRHAQNAVQAPALAAHLFDRAARYLRAQGPQGNLLTSSGPYATQTIDHLHVHVIPRGPSCELPSDWPWMRGES